MRILLTNHRLTNRGGTEAIIRDLTLGLIARGHEAVVYSSIPPEADNSLAEDGVPFVTDIAALPFVPDVIHAHHRIDTMAALMALPTVPAVYCCHGATRSDAQPRHPRIVRYTAVTQSLKLRMAVESGIPESMIDVVHNAVDTGRFHAVRTPPAVPRRALVFSRALVEDTPVGRLIREAATRVGLDLVFGRRTHDERPIRSPQDALLDYDIVFASGKSAIDAMATGCAVIVLGGAAGGLAPAGCGEMVDPANFERLRMANFALPVNSRPPGTDEIVRQISRYDARDVAAVTALIRRVASFDAFIDRYLQIYGLAIAGRRSVTDEAAEARAAHDYLRSLFAWVRLGEEEIGSRLIARDDGHRPAPALNTARLVEVLARQVDAIRGHPTLTRDEGAIRDDAR